MTAGPPDPGGASRRILVFLGSAAASAAVLAAAGWFSGVREVMHGVIVGLAILAFFPLVVAAGGIFAMLAVTIMTVIAGFLGGGDPGLGDGSSFAKLGILGGIWLFPRYYGFWARRRHPALWGVLFGGLVAALILGGLVAFLVLPGEAETVRVLAETQGRIEDFYRTRKRYPAPSGEGGIDRAALGAGGGPIRDGFGRPLSFAVTGRGRVASYQVRSLGFDGRPGRDDFCVHGQTRLMDMAEVVGGIARGVQVNRGRAVVDRLRQIRALRCDP